MFPSRTSEAETGQEQRAPFLLETTIPTVSKKRKASPTNIRNKKINGAELLLIPRASKPTLTTPTGDFIKDKKFMDKPIFNSYTNDKENFEDI